MAYTFKQPISQPRLADGAALNRGNHVLTNEQVNCTWFSRDNLRWNDEELNLPDDPHGTLLLCRGRDMPEFPRLQRVKKTAWVWTKARGTLVLVDGNSKNELIFGGSEAAVKQGQFRFNVDLGTQTPNLGFSYKEEAAENKIICHRVILHGNTAMKDVEYHNPSSIKAGKAKFNIPPPHRNAAAEGRLLALTVEFGETEYHERLLNCVTVLNDGKGDKEVDRWASDIAMLKDFETQHDKHFFDKAIRAVLLGKGLKMVFLREIDPADIHVLDRFEHEYLHWEHVMRLSIKLGGPFWFYRMQPGFDNSPGAYFSRWSSAENPPPVPFWLVKKFQALVGDKGLIKLVPLEIATIVRDSYPGDGIEWRLPHPDLATLLHELNLAREKWWRYVVAHTVFQSSRRHPTTIRFLKQIENQQFFRLDVDVVATVEEGSKISDGQKILPDPGSMVTFDLFLGVNQKVTGRGKVVNEINKAKNVDLVIHCQLYNTKANNLLSQAKNGKISLYGTFSMQDNYLSVDRMAEGFRGAVRNVPDSDIAKRMGTPDARNFLLGYRPRFSGNINKLPNPQVAIDAFMAKLGRPKGQNFDELCELLGFGCLNTSQRGSIRSAINGGKGNLTVVRGPPGTGKSFTLAALVLILNFVLGSRCVVTAPSNQACEAILEKIDDVYSRVLVPLGLKCTIVRFVTQAGTPIDQSNATAQVGSGGLSIDEAGLDEVALASRDKWKTGVRFAAYSLHEQKKDFARKSQWKPELAEWKMTGSVWLKALQKAVDGLLFGGSRKDYKIADEKIGREILKRTNILVGTLKSMGRLELTAHCPIDTVVIDGCAQASLAEITIPFNAFEKTIKRAVFGGDDSQLPAVVPSERANETASFVKRSIFREIRLKETEYSVHLLDVQYRCHPFIYRWSNETFFENKVTAAGRLGDTTPLDLTVAAFMEQQLPSGKWNRLNMPRVIAIDINAPSVNYPGSHSAHNPHEVAFAVWLRKCLLNAQPPANGASLRVADITMISPYRGQLAALLDKIKEDGDAQDTGQVATIAKSQGSECAIGISSFTKNNPKDPVQLGFFAEPANINVWFTRQKRFHFVIGCFTARHAVRTNIFRSKRSYEAYNALLDELCGRRLGVTLVEPKDFAGWPGFSHLLGSLR